MFLSVFYYSVVAHRFTVKHTDSVTTVTEALNPFLKIVIFFISTFFLPTIHGQRHVHFFINSAKMAGEFLTKRATTSAKH